METVQPTIESGATPDQGSLIPRLGPGRTGVVMARAGAGKTACLTHIAIEHLLREEPVLHVCIDAAPERIKVWYRELMRNIFAGRPEFDVAILEHRIWPLRFILSYLNQTFSPEKLEQSLLKLAEQARFVPSLVILDGVNFEKTPRSALEALRTLAARHSAPLWMSARTHRDMDVVNERGVPYPCHESDDLFDVILRLEPEAEAIRVATLKPAGEDAKADFDVLLDPHTYVLRKGGARPAAKAGKESGG